MKFCGAAKKLFPVLAFGILSFVFNANAQDSLHQNLAETEFFEVESTKEKVAGLIATGTAAYSRQLSPTRFIVQFHKGFTQHQSRRVEGFSWKMLQKGLNTEEHTAFIIGYTNAELLKQDLRQRKVKFQMLKERKREHAMVLQLDSKYDKEAVFQSPYVTSIDRADKIAREETLVNYHDLSVNKINPVHHMTSYSGDGFAVSIKERSFNKSDIDLKGRYFTYPLESLELSVHANFMATIAAGGGNSAPNSRGAAWKAKVSSSDFGDLFADDPDVLSQFGITAQNNSYGIPFGDPLESYYGDQAVSYDVAVTYDPTLLYVFSAGNSGLFTGTDGTYAGLSPFATLTGNYKMAKNVLVVGGHYKDYTVDSRNSRGPAYDGRIKPELVAYGEDGTSDAAAIATGVGVLIQEAYKTSAGVTPPVSLTKASMIASADDAGAAGIDHVTGYGAIHAAKAIEIIDTDQFALDAVSEGEVKTFPLEIPPGLKKVSIALVWTDPAAQPGEAFALVNDLDLYLTDPLNNKTLPWVLSTYPRMDSLTKAPKRKADHLNNVELVTLEDPAPGTYEIAVSGFDVVSGAQSFSVAWSFDEADNFNWTFPLEGEAVEADREIYLRWDNTIEGTGMLEMSVAGGAWQLVESDVLLKNGFLQWIAPDVNASVKLRMNTGLSLVETGTFTVSKQLPVKVVYNCTQDGMIAWNKIPEATAYQVSALGVQFLEPVATIVDTSFMIDKASIASEYFSVIPVIDGETAYGSFAYNVNNQGVNCYYTTFYGLAGDASAQLFLNLSTLYNVEHVVFEKLVNGVFVSIGTLTTLTASLQFDDPDIKPGTTYYRAIIELLSGEQSVTDVISVMYADETTFMLWPNPVKAGEPLNIFSDGQDLSICFYTPDGRIVEKLKVEGSFFSPSVQSMVLPGMFIYQIFRGGTRVATGKLVVVN